MAQLIDLKLLFFTPGRMVGRTKISLPMVDTTTTVSNLKYSET